MNKFLKIVHLLGLAMFVGSIFGHILLGSLSDPGADLAGFAVLMKAKYMNVLLLTMSGLILMLLTGIALMWRRGITPKRARWMAAKLVLVALIILNGTFVLTPLSRDMATLAQDAVTTGTVPVAFYDLQRKEDVFGTANLVIILAVMGLAAAKPALRRNNGAKRRSGEAVV